MAPNLIESHFIGDYLQSGSSSPPSYEVVRRPLAQHSQLPHYSSPYVYAYMCSSRMENAKENEKNKISEEEINEFLQRRLDDKNRMAWGASSRGGYLTVRDEIIAEILKEREKEEMEQKDREKKWFEIMDPSNGNSYAIEIIRDRCSSDNFVTAQTVASYSLETKDVGPKEFNGIAGGEFTCYKQAKIHWKGKNGEMREDFFYVLPKDSRIQNALAGKEFVEAFGNLRTCT
ncbi:hypothetical protein F5Y04DRAFT_106438 [Hypomontagnella monticulosa]|nr:hypothetical protein F5Y04DRAFT_106438 [Hypomontagnella monticulosa]